MASIVILRNAITLNKSSAKCLISWKFYNLQCNLHTGKSSNHAAIHRSCENKVKNYEADTKSAFDKLDLTFTDTKEAYKSKKTSELVRAYLVLKLSSFDSLVLNHEKLIKLGRRVLGNSAFAWIVKKSFYAQFVAGEDEKSIKPRIDHLRSFGVKAIFDYSAEEDMQEESSKSTSKDKSLGKKVFQHKNLPQVELPSTGVDEQKLKQFQHHKEDDQKSATKDVVARTYFYLNEAQCEKNMEIFLKCIDAVAGTTAHTGFAAVKLTALGRPQLLLQLSEVIARTRMFFTEVTGVDRMVLGQVTASEFKDRLDKRFHIKSDDPEVKKWFSQMDGDKAGLMNLFSWNGLVDMEKMMSDVFKVINIRTGKIERVISCLTREEEEMFKNTMRRIHTIAKHAKETDVRVMIDAEQSYFQPAINRITMELMRKYNKEKAIIFNTYQCYLKNAYENLIIDLELARRQGFYFGAKLVRGAYIMQERARAKQVGYEDPINPTFEATTEMYQKCLSECMNQIKTIGLDTKKISIMVASHNEDTVRYTVKEMQKLDIQPHHKLICFGQLLGMCDHVSFLLGQSGYSVYKYAPYGPVDEVLPYLCRRAVENHGVLEKVGKERILMFKEINRRLLTGQLFHKPLGNYTPA